MLKKLLFNIKKLFFFIKDMNIRKSFRQVIFEQLAIFFNIKFVRLIALKFVYQTEFYALLFDFILSLHLKFDLLLWPEYIFIYLFAKKDVFIVIFFPI